MTDDALVISERHDNGVVLLRLNRPPLNPLSYALLDAISDAAEALADDASVKAVVLTGGDRAFAAGADINEFTDPEASQLIGASFRRAIDALPAIPRPVIAAISGYALGGGLEVALACDVRVAGDSARVGFPEILLGIFPGGGGTQRLPRLVGPARAKEIIWSGRQVRADEARALGIVDRVVPADEVLDRALAWAAELASGAVVAMGMAKRLVDEGLELPLPVALDLEQQAFVDVRTTDDAKVGIQSFLDHGPGKAEFSGR
ncbi:MAG: enoyl-CoA hydratase-related protein [Acidimicrobiia bacterium]